MSSSAGPRDGEGIVMVRDAKCWNIFPVEVAVCSSWRRGQESGVTGSGTQPDIYTVSTQYLQYPHRQPGVSWSRWAHRCTRAAHTGWRAHTHSSVTRDSAEEQLSVSVTRPRTSVTCHEGVSRSCHDGDRGPGLPAGPLPPRVARHAAPAAQAAALLAQ